MKKYLFTLSIVAVLLGLSTTAQAQIAGTYVETRNAEVYTGFCVANGEVNLAGDQAILAWQIGTGNWDGVSLDGLGVVGVVRASATLGDRDTNPYPARAVLIVDERGSALQRKALVSFAQAMSGQLLRNVVQIVGAPIQMDIGHDGGHNSNATVKAGDLASIVTRPISPTDHLCGNESTFYPPLAILNHSMAAVAELDQYNGPGLGVQWTSHGKRSAFVGTFAADGPAIAQN